ncbi:predicted protein [Phaeodactylum tricornutum CCAP 1055/1]|uniref:Uncharacterized protein n=1 Tax=Phaeodactylum tricornutum (strain CCAP 1055/1) TaxID=556484 RepID=B7G9H1_PHATC|nr:predicted protein [Phaeodactylum tricornutum CCAP 1055/1]EEC44817.1 predicted protein [Phaeodactylum tricornutum CCAP 1055/1]|eukprot:XP_002183635.1 predicted protein [Phaeodactylum tricornutum CCAP 1055/1]
MNYQRWRDTDGDDSRSRKSQRKRQSRGTNSYQRPWNVEDDDDNNNNNGSNRRRSTQSTSSSRSQSRRSSTTPSHTQTTKSRSSRSASYTSPAITTTTRVRNRRSSHGPVGPSTTPVSVDIDVSDDDDDHDHYRNVDSARGSHGAAYPARSTPSPSAESTTSAASFRTSAALENRTARHYRRRTPSPQAVVSGGPEAMGPPGSISRELRNRRLASQRPSSPVAIRPAVPLPVQAAASIPPRPHNPPQVPAVESAPKTPSPQAVAVDSRRGGAAFFKRTAPVPIDAEDSARLLQLEREARENELAKLRQARWVRDNEREQTRSAAARIEDPPLTQSSHPPTSRIVPSVIPLDPNPTVVAESSRRGHTDDVQPSTIPAAVIASPRKAVVRPDPEPREKVDRPVPRRSTSRPVTPPPGPTSDDVSDVGSAASDVGRYLAQRKSSSSPNPAFLASRAAFAGKTLTTNGTRPMRNALPLAADNEASDGNESDDSEETTTEEESSSDEDPDVPEWSVRVCVVSAIDLPANVVPNLPFSPVFDIGLVRFPGPDVDSRIQLPGDDASRQNLSALLTKGGLHSVPRSRVQCTNLKTLSQRDNGSVEFHEELRWDRVKYPEELALAIQLSAKAVIAPANIKENPPMQKVQPLQFGNPSAQNGTGWNSAGKTSSGSSSEAGGSLFRRTQKSSAEMETANAAAAVAQLLVTGEKSKADDEGRLFDSKAANSKAVSGNRSELNVKLKHRKRRRKPKLTDDLRLGSQIVPLTALPLRKAYGQEHEARIEQWFELDGASDVTPTTPSPASSPARGNRRNPSILLEITFSAPEVLDDSCCQGEGEG